MLKIRSQVFTTVLLADSIMSNSNKSCFQLIQHCRCRNCYTQTIISKGACYSNIRYSYNYICSYCNYIHFHQSTAVNLTYWWCYLLNQYLGEPLGMITRNDNEDFRWLKIEDSQTRLRSRSELVLESIGSRTVVVQQ